MSGAGSCHPARRNKLRDLRWPLGTLTAQATPRQTAGNGLPPLCCTHLQARWRS